MSVLRLCLRVWLEVQEGRRSRMPSPAAPRKPCLDRSRCVARSLPRALVCRRQRARTFSEALVAGLIVRFCHRSRAQFSRGPAEVALLRVCWAALDGICSKRLAPFARAARALAVLARTPPCFGRDDTTDSDSGSEFLNTVLIAYCADQHITFTRGRAYRKNDGCFVEQKNWAVVRRLVGYQRLEAPVAARKLALLPAATPRVRAEPPPCVFTRQYACRAMVCVVAQG